MLFLKEIRFRKLNFALGTVGMVVAVAIVVLFFMMTAASQNETRRLTRDMGFNLRIIPDSTDMNNFWISGYSDQSMPEEYVDKLVNEKAFYYAHLTATLHKHIEWNDKEVILTGISPNERDAKTGAKPKIIFKKKSKMIFAIEPGTVYVGFELARDKNINVGDKLDVLGKTFEVKQTLAETGTESDIRMYFDLKDLQSLLNMRGQINEIMALNCLCTAEGDDPLEELRIQLNKTLPNTKVIMNRTIAVARERQRKMMDNYFAVLLPLFLIACVIWIGTFSMINVLGRRTEIGIMRSLGMGSWSIAKLFFARSVLTGVIGAVLGFLLATWLGFEYGEQVFKVTAQSIKPVYSLFYWSMLIAPLFAAMAALIPIVFAIKQEPAEVLKDE